MTRISPIAPESATGTVADQLAQIRSAFGTVPAMFGTVARSPAALTSMWSSFGAYGSGSLGPTVSEQIAVAVANRNTCSYCLSAHTALGRKAGLSREQLADAQLGRSDDPAVAALLTFALAVVDSRGHISDGDLDAARAAGWSDEQIVETVGQVALNIFTNYVNVALGVRVDFPVIDVR